MKKKFLAILIAIGLLTLVPTQIIPAAEPCEHIVYFPRLTVVDYKDNTLLDEVIYLSAIPPSLYKQGTSKYVSALIFDKLSQNEEYLVQDIAQRWGSDTQIVKIGDVNQGIIDDFESITQPGEIVSITTLYTVFDYASAIAEYFWTYSNTAVLVPIPDIYFGPVFNEGNNEYVDYVETASNGAVIASLKNCPLLFTDTYLPTITKDTLINLGVDNVIFLNPPEFEIGPIFQELNNMGIEIVDHLTDIRNIIQYIKNIRDTNYLTFIYNNYESRNKPWTSVWVNEFFMSETDQALAQLFHSPSYRLKEMYESTEEKITKPESTHTCGDMEEVVEIVTVGGHWTEQEEADTIGEEDEMPFGSAAFIAAFHNSPVITFPTENTHCQNADDNAEAIGDWFYDVYKHNYLVSGVNFIFPRIGKILADLGILEWWEDTPDYNDMVSISSEFYWWLNDLSIDDPFCREKILIVGDISEIDPSLDRSIMGKAIAGRIGSGEGHHAACIINRNVLYPELIQIVNNNDVVISMVAYAHCLPFQDNDGVWHYVIESEGVTQAYSQEGYDVVHQNTIGDTTDAISSARFWVHVGHAYYGDKPVVGQGVFNHFLPEGAWRAYEYGGSTADPDQYGPGGPAYPPDGEVNPPHAENPDIGIYEKMAETDYTNDWTDLSGNVHSMAIYFLLCNIGGCQMPVLWQKSGASVVFASYASVSFAGGGWFDTILNEEIADGNTYGQAFLTALQETSSLYSEDIQGRDDTLQYLIYGDPSLRLIKG